MTIGDFTAAAAKHDSVDRKIVVMLVTHVGLGVCARMSRPFKRYVTLFVKI